jgi:Na+-transporting methylmalonyl-CoA/oxaloacetate decarboxylase gamma subunit
MSIIAFSIVFLVIAGLMFMMMALKVIVRTINPEKPAAARTESANPTPPPAVTAAVRYEPPASDDGELVAVFAAAIAEMSGHAAAVLSYAPVEMALRRPSASAWKMAGIFSNSRGLRD